MHPCKPQSNIECIVVLVHGIRGIGDGGYSAPGGQWDQLRTFLIGNGADTVDAVGYYRDDCYSDHLATHAGPRGLTDSRSHYEWFATSGGHGSDSECAGTGTLYNVHSMDTDIRHLSYHLAWYLYHKYSVNDKTVTVYGHSMGGLMIRYALAHNGETDWPPSLLVDEVITAGTPHDGSDECLSWTNRQADQMCHESSFLDWMWDHAQSPNGASGTDWLLIGSDCDWVVEADSATSLDTDHYVGYIDTGTPNPSWCPTHTGSGTASYMGQDAVALDAEVFYYDAWDLPPAEYYWDEAPNSDAWSWNAISLGALW